MHARCSHCGNTVMPYRRAFFYNPRSPVKCAHCGTEVRLRHFHTLAWSFIAGGGILGLAAVLLARSVNEFVVAGVAVALVAVAADYWSWRALPWDPMQPSEAPQPPSPATQQRREPP
jgi:hypothetical protein